METVAPLVRAVVRAFYADEFSVVIEPLLREPYYMEDDDQARGPLSQILGGLSATRIRRTLSGLVQHSLVQKKQIVVQGLLVNVEENEREGSKTTRYFYYIDFVHFVKILSLRLAQIPRLIETSQSVDPLASMAFRCPTCEKSYDVLDANHSRMMCPDDGTDLVAIDVAPSTGLSSTVTSRAQIDALLKRFQVQMSGELDQRDNIHGLLKQAQNLGRNIPENDPKRRLDEQEREKRRLEALARENQEGLPEVGEAMMVSGGTQKQRAGEWSWLQKNVKGELTEDAIKDAEERELKRSRMESAKALDHASSRGAESDDYVRAYEQQRREELARLQQQQQQTVQEQIISVAPASAPATSTNSDAVFSFQDGGSIRAGEVTDDNLDKLIARCNVIEYDAFVNFLKENTAFE